MGEPKPFLSYDQQLDRLAARGLVIEDRASARSWLERVNYYRLSGYWYPFRRAVDGRRADTFADGSRFADVIALYAFDERLRTAVFAALAPVELTVRAVLGHALARLHPQAHLRPDLLGAAARSGDEYVRWLAKHRVEVLRSREDFVVHHRAEYEGVLPVWAAVELLDWGALVRLLAFAPPSVQDAVAETFGLRAPQIVSWLRALNIVRNACAHHGRLFNRVYTKRPRLPEAGRVPALDQARPVMNRTFGQLTLVQHLRRESGIGQSTLLATVLGTFPETPRVPLRTTGAPEDWRTSDLWDGAR